MEAQRRPGQHADETAIEYLRRVVNNLGLEPESMLDQLPSVEAVCDYFDLWAKYGTDFWAGCMECIAEGESAEPALEFVRKWKLGEEWEAEIRHAEECREPAMAEVNPGEDDGEEES